MRIQEGALKACYFTSLSSTLRGTLVLSRRLSWLDSKQNPWLNHAVRLIKLKLRLPAKNASKEELLSFP